MFPILYIILMPLKLSKLASDILFYTLLIFVDGSIHLIRFKSISFHFFFFFCFLVDCYQKVKKENMIYIHDCNAIALKALYEYNFTHLHTCISVKNVRTTFFILLLLFFFRESSLVGGKFSIHCKIVLNANRIGVIKL